MKRLSKKIAAGVIGLLVGISAWAGLETVTTIQDLNTAWPLGSDLASTSDDHIRNIKTALKNTFPATTQGSILYNGTTANEFVALAKSTTATRYLANTGTSNNPAWDQVNLSNGVTGTLAITSLDKTTAATWSAAQTFTAIPFAVITKGNTATYELQNDAGTEISRLATVNGWVGSGSVTDAAVASRADMYFYADNSSNPTVHLTSSAIEGRGATAAGLVDMTPDTGTFTATYTGMSASTTCTATWSRVGKIVVLTFCVATGNSNSTSFTMTGLPAAIQPSALAQHVSVASDAVTNNSITVSGVVGAGIAAASGTVTFFIAGSSTGWTASNSKGFNSNASVSYELN